MNKRFAQLRSFASRNKVAVAAGGALVGLSAHAVGPYDSITSAVDWSTVGAAIVSIAALKAGPAVVSVGSKMVLRMIGR